MLTDTHHTPYKLLRSGRAKRVSITVRRDAVIVTAPLRASERMIRSFVEKHGDWVQKRIETLKKTRAEWVMPEYVKQDHFIAARARAKKFILERLKQYRDMYRVGHGRVTIKDMKSRWGSCSREKNISFHYRLLFLPVELADYVIVHELCHTVHLNHSRRFWALVGKTIPDYQKRRRELARYGL